MVARDHFVMLFSELYASLNALSLQRKLWELKPH